MEKGFIAYIGGMNAPRFFRMGTAVVSLPLESSHSSAMMTTCSANTPPPTPPNPTSGGKERHLAHEVVRPRCMLGGHAYFPGRPLHRYPLHPLSLGCLWLESTVRVADGFQSFHNHGQPHAVFAVGKVLISLRIKMMPLSQTSMMMTVNHSSNRMYSPWLSR